MTIEEAKEILSHNVLSLPNAGLDYFPVKIVNIESFRYSNPDKNERCRYVELLAMMDVTSNLPKTKNVFEGSHYCTAFFLFDGSDYYYRDFFYEAMDVIAALRVVNNYTPNSEHSYS